MKSELNLYFQMFSDQINKRKQISRLFLPFIFLCFKCNLEAQINDCTNKYTKHSIYYNYHTAVPLGHFHSINYERNLKNKLKIRGGFNHLRIQGDRPWSVDTHLGILYGITYLMGKNNFYLEISTGIISAYLYKSNVKVRTIPFFEVGGRYEPKNKGIILRANFGIFTVGVGCGYKFE